MGLFLRRFVGRKLLSVFKLNTIPALFRARQKVMPLDYSSTLMLFRRKVKTNSWAFNILI